MAWRRAGGKLLSEPMMVLFTGAYMRHSASMSKKMKYMAKIISSVSPHVTGYIILEYPLQTKMSVTDIWSLAECYRFFSIIHRLCYCYVRNVALQLTDICNDWLLYGGFWSSVKWHSIVYKIRIFKYIVCVSKRWWFAVHHDIFITIFSQHRDVSRRVMPRIT